MVHYYIDAWVCENHIQLANKTVPECKAWKPDEFDLIPAPISAMKIDSKVLLVGIFLSSGIAYLL